MASPVSLCVFRWTAGQAERLDEYRVTAAADTTVLDALVEIQRTQDPTLAFRYAARAPRWRVLLSDGALARCHGQGNCTEVCPMGLSPADSIRRLRRLAVSRVLGLSG